MVENLVKVIRVQDVYYFFFFFYFFLAFLFVDGPRGSGLIGSQLEWKSLFGNALWDGLRSKVTYYDGLSEKGAFWNRCAFREKKAGDSYTYAV